MRPIDADALMEYCNNLKDKTIDANDIARFPTIGGWISVKDRLPEISYKCAVVVRGYGGHAFVQAADYLTSRCDWYMWERNTMAKEIDYEITHWMPFPEPPKEE